MSHKSVQVVKKWLGEQFQFFSISSWLGPKPNDPLRFFKNCVAFKGKDYSTKPIKWKLIDSLKTRSAVMKMFKSSLTPSGRNIFVKLNLNPLPLPSWCCIGVSCLPGSELQRSGDTFDLAASCDYSTGHTGLRYENQPPFEAGGKLCLDKNIEHYA